VEVLVVFSWGHDTPENAKSQAKYVSLIFPDMLSKKQ
jgi:hypothetical protein